MKVLVARSSSFITCKFVQLALQYRWSVFTYEGIVSKIFKYLNIIYIPFSESPHHTITVSHCLGTTRFSFTGSSISLYIEYVLAGLPPRKLRRVLALCEVIALHPDYFDFIFSRFNLVPICDLNRYISLDYEYRSKLGRNKRRKYILEKVDILAV
jgi:hypothetical protein